MENVKQLNECLCCGSKNLSLTLDLGEQPMANSFIKTEDADELVFPLKLNRCRECDHLQLSHAVNPDLLFRDYLYVSGTSKTLKDYFDRFASWATSNLFFDNKPTTVLDIACNDGTQLDSFKTAGFNTYGIDPAINLHALSSVNHAVVCDYFKQEHVEHYKNLKIDVINAQNVFAHNDYPLEFLKQCKEIMHDESVLFIQTSQADMVKNNQFDTIYHEHLSFFNANSMKELAHRAGLPLIHISKTEIHGTSYVFAFSKTRVPDNTVEDTLAEEQLAGLHSPATYIAYAKKCQQVTADLKEALIGYKAGGYVLAGYGAAAKGMTLLNYGNIQLDFVIDDNPLKQGLFTPGTHIPVVSIDMLKECEDLNVVFVPLAWNFYTEIRNRILQVRNKEGDVFVRYFPTISIDRNVE